MKSIRIFISSPGDVANERQICGKVIEKIQGRYWSLIRIEDVFWENEAMRATATFQDEIDDPADCEIVIGIIWTKLGSPLPERFKKIDGSPHANGTEWEIGRAITAFESKIRAGEDPKAAFPNVVIYRRKEERTPYADPAEEAKAKANEGYVEEYFRREFHNNDEFRTFKRASISYTSIEDFEKKLLKHLAKLVLKQIPVLKTAFNIPPISGSPFKALQAFEFHENDRFFGRTREIREIQTRLIRNARNGLPFILIYGGSGYGKSSLMKAGLAPALTRPGGSLGNISGWRRVSFQPAKGQGSLCTRLASALLQGPDVMDAARVRDLEHYPSIGLPEIADRSLGQKCWDVSSLASQLSDPDQIRNAAAIVAKSLKGLNRHLLLEIDQLEEAFAFTDTTTDSAITEKGALTNLSDEEREKQLYCFFMALGGLAQTGRVWVVATMRSEFFPKVAEIPELFALVGKNRGFILPPPSRHSLWEIIRYPAFAARLEFEKRTSMLTIGAEEAKFDDLDEQILHDAESSPDALPLLEFSLQGLYDERSGTTLNWKSYAAAGGLKGAIAKRATEVYQSLGEVTKDARHKIFSALIHIEPARGIQTRKRAPLDSLKKAPGAAEFIQAFQDANLLITDEDNQQKESVVILAHEALLTHWEELSSWIKEHAEVVLARQRLAEQVKLWKDNEEKRTYLLSEARLAEAIRTTSSEIFDLRNDEIRYVSRSLKRSRLKRNLLLVSLIIFGIVAAIAAIAAIQAKTQQKIATKATAGMLIEKDLSQSRLAQNLFRQARSMERNGDSSKAMVLYLESAMTKPDFGAAVDHLFLCIARHGIVIEYSLGKMDPAPKKEINLLTQKENHVLLGALSEYTTRYDQATGRISTLNVGETDSDLGQGKYAENQNVAEGEAALNYQIIRWDRSKREDRVMTGFISNETGVSSEVPLFGIWMESPGGTYILNASQYYPGQIVLDQIDSYEEPDVNGSLWVSLFDGKTMDLLDTQEIQCGFYDSQFGSKKSIAIDLDETSLGFRSDNTQLFVASKNSNMNEYRLDLFEISEYDDEGASEDLNSSKDGKRSALLSPLSEAWSYRSSTVPFQFYVDQPILIEEGNLKSILRWSGIGLEGYCPFWTKVATEPEDSLGNDYSVSTAQQSMWAVIRDPKNFTKRDLVAAAKTSWKGDLVAHFSEGAESVVKRLADQELISVLRIPTQSGEGGSAPFAIGWTGNDRYVLAETFSTGGDSISTYAFEPLTGERAMEGAISNQASGTRGNLLGLPGDSEFVEGRKIFWNNILTMSRTATKPELEDLQEIFHRALRWRASSSGGISYAESFSPLGKDEALRNLNEIVNRSWFGLASVNTEEKKIEISAINGKTKKTGKEGYPIVNESKNTETAE